MNCIRIETQWWIYVVKFWIRAPSGSKFFQFHGFENFWQNCMFAPPRQGNPGSATGTITLEISFGCQPNPHTSGLVSDNQNLLLGDGSLTLEFLNL